MRDDPIWDNGEPTEYGVEVFTAGDCWVLAYYLHALGGWPVFSIAPRDDLNYWEHVVIQLDDETYFDVTGPRDAKEMLELWGGSNYVYVLEGARFTSWRAYQLYFGGDLTEFLFPNSKAKAKRMARFLYDKYELEGRRQNG